MRVPGSRLLVLAAPFLFTACATIGAPQPPSLDLPKPSSDLRAERKGQQVTLTWTVPTTTTDRQTIRSLGPTRICRALTSVSQCGSPVGETPAQLNPPRASAQKPTASYADTLPPEVTSDDPSAFAIYAIEVLNRKDRSAGLSNQVRVSLIRTLPPPRDFQALVTSQGVVLSWTCDIPAEGTRPETHHLVRVFRRREGSSEQTVVGDVSAAGGEQSLTDSSIEWEKTYEYHAAVVTAIDLPNKPSLQVEGANTPEVKVFADDVFPPAVPSGLQAVFSGPGQKPFIDLVWAPVTDLDLDGYNVYRREEGTALVKINAELVKTPAYRDTNVMSGKRYFYSVSAVDVRGNESAQSEEASENVP